MGKVDIAIIGAGMAGASLAAMIGSRARCILIEAEAQPGYHATGRSAAFWSETYGGPAVQPLTTASRAFLQTAGVLRPRGCLHIADVNGSAALERLAGEMTRAGVPLRRLGRAQLEQHLPGIRGAYRQAIEEPTCQDIDVASLHALFLKQAAGAGTQILTHARVKAIDRHRSSWRIATAAGDVQADLIVNAAGAWADSIATLAGVAPIDIQPYRRTMAQLATDPPVPADTPLVIEARGAFYFKPEAGGRLWLSPHDETAVAAHDVAPEEIDVAVAIDRLEQAVDWRVLARERAWAGLRSFAPDRLPVYGFDPRVAGFFWFAGQGGFGIQTAPAAAMIGAAALLERPPDYAVAHIDAERYAPNRFVSDARVA
jgi:D-arginine dehydrogenase